VWNSVHGLKGDDWERLQRALMLLTSSDGKQQQRRRDAGRIAERRLGVLRGL